MADPTRHEAGSKEPQEIVQICAWCLPQRINILDGGDLEPGETMEVQLGFTGKKVTVRKGTPGWMRHLTVSHGICPECAAKERARAGVLATDH